MMDRTTIVWMVIGPLTYLIVAGAVFGRFKDYFRADNDRASPELVAALWPIAAIFYFILLAPVGLGLRFGSWIDPKERSKRVEARRAAMEAAQAANERAAAEGVREKPYR